MSTRPSTQLSGVPNRRQSLVFRAKTFGLQLQRFVGDRIDGELKPKGQPQARVGSALIAESVSPLWTETEPQEKVLVAGKIHNLRIAIGKLDGVEIAADEVFSFWKHVGRTSRLRGFVKGRELREGCIIPNTGGGLCQLSNGLYDAALKAGFEIVERHAHTQVIPGSLAEQGRDATVFWNYVDLRFKSVRPFRIQARLDGKALTVRFIGEENGPVSDLTKQELRNRTGERPRSCMTCEVTSCHRVVESAAADFGRTAFLVDEYWPEFDEYVQHERRGNDALFTPIDGRRFRKPNYGWTTGGFSNVTQSFYVTAARSYQSRRLAAQGASRQLNLLRNYERLAESYARRLTFDMLHVVVQQDLLPFLWRAGYLGGRTFDVLMTALPMKEIQRRLDAAKALHPASKTLSDFRANERLVEAESEALKQARKIISPHSGIAALFGESSLVNWHLPNVEKRPPNKNQKPVVVFPASTVGRKGCYELREALRGLDIKLVRLGPDIETDNFWDGFDAVWGGDDWMGAADVVVSPAFVEHRPRRLLGAAAAGIPVIASSACGLEGVSGVETIAAGDPEMLRQKILAALA